MPAVVLQPRSCGATLSNYLQHVYPRRSVVACNYVAASLVPLENRLSTYSVCELSERLLHPLRVIAQNLEFRWFNGRRDANAPRPI